jgi:hypothetical protein
MILFQIILKDYSRGSAMDCGYGLGPLPGVHDLNREDIIDSLDYNECWEHNVWRCTMSNGMGHNARFVNKLYRGYAALRSREVLKCITFLDLLLMLSSDP